MIIAKTIAELISITRITLIALAIQEQSNIMLAEIIQIMKMCENHHVPMWKPSSTNVYM